MNEACVPWESMTLDWVSKRAMIPWSVRGSTPRVVHYSSTRSWRSPLGSAAITSK